MSTHSILAPSSAGRWAFCPGAPLLEAKYPQDDTDDTREGEASHYIGSEVLINGGAADACNDFTGLTLFNGVVADQVMVDAAVVYVAAVLSIVPAGVASVEKSVQIPAIHAQCFGTPDSWCYDAVKKVLHIWDYKYGWGIVEAFENRQGLCYYSGILAKLGLSDNDIMVALHIVQPRPYHPEGSVRTWLTPAVNVRPLVNQLHNAAHKALGADPEYCSGKHCRNCKGRHACLSAEQAAGYAVDISGTHTPRELDNVGVGIELAILQRAAEALKYRITGLEAQGLELKRKGLVVPGQKISYGSGSTVWTKPVGEVLALGDIMGVQLRKPETPVTPKQAITAGVSKELIESYSEHSSGKARLAPDDNSKTRQIFGGTAQ